jgi:hypothetical protein
MVKRRENKLENQGMCPGGSEGEREERIIQLTTS